MVDRSAARNQYCWIASITPRKYNKALQSLLPLPYVTSRARQSCPRRDNGRSRGYPVGRLEGTRWLGPHNPPSSSSRSTTSFSLFSFSPCLFYSLSVCLMIPHHDASRSRPAECRALEESAQWVSGRAGERLALSPTARSPVSWRSPNTSWRLCVVPIFFFSVPVCSMRFDNRDDAKMTVVQVFRALVLDLFTRPAK